MKFAISAIEASFFMWRFDSPSNSGTAASTGSSFCFGLATRASSLERSLDGGLAARLAGREAAMHRRFGARHARVMSEVAGRVLVPRKGDTTVAERLPRSPQPLPLELVVRPGGIVVQQGEPY